MKAIVLGRRKKKQEESQKLEVELRDDDDNLIELKNYDLSIEVEIPKIDVTSVESVKPEFVTGPIRLRGTLTIPCEVEIERTDES